MPSTIQLQEHQVTHYHRICEILLLWFAYLDTSEMGSGKTFTAMAIAATFKLDILLVGPVSTLSMWIAETSKYGIRLVSTMSYPTMAGTVKTGCNHPFLVRQDNTFIPTEYFRQCVERGLLLVFDEAHHLKNSSTAQLKAAHALVREIVRMNCGSRVAALSALPCDKEVHTISLMKVLGIITCLDLYTYDHGMDEYVLLGMTQLLDTCEKSDKKTTDDVRSNFPVLDRRTIPKVCFQLYTQVIKPHVASSMKRPEMIESDIKNGYYRIDLADVVELTAAIGALHRATSFNERTGEIQVTEGSWGAITKSLMRMERIKIRIMARVVSQILSDDPRAKIAVYVWHKESYTNLAASLDEFRPMVMTGDTKPTQRDAISQAFQQPTADYRLIISNPVVGGIGISLDDREGSWPRYAFIIPNYRFLDLHQTTGRFRRVTSKSVATIRFVYAKIARSETGILDALTRKTRVARAVIDQGEDDQIILPGEYKSYTEPDEPNQDDPKQDDPKQDDPKQEE